MNIKARQLASLKSQKKENLKNEKNYETDKSSSIHNSNINNNISPDQSNYASNTNNYMNKKQNEINNQKSNPNCKKVKQIYQKIFFCKLFTAIIKQNLVCRAEEKAIQKK